MTKSKPRAALSPGQGKALSIAIQLQRRRSLASKGRGPTPAPAAAPTAESMASLEPREADLNADPAAAGGAAPNTVKQEPTPTA